MTTNELAGPRDTSAVVEHPTHIVRFLVEKGLVGEADEIVATSLTGGVSNDVFAITAPGLDVVVKQALSKLRVDADWFASPARISTEARALEIAGAILPDNVPPVLALDPEQHLMVIGRAPRTSYEWKSDLMAGVVEDAIAVKLGQLLGHWHRETAVGSGVDRSLGDRSAFIELRVDPFYRWVSGKHAAVRTTIDEVVERMLATKACMVHGDFSPKNVLIGSAAPWVLDWEVAHIGDPVFDVALATAHFLCKALYRPEIRTQYRQSSDSFLTAYLATVGSSVGSTDHEYLTRQIACLLLARIDGKSPAPYLDEEARSRGRAVALSVLSASHPELELLWAY